LASAKAGYWRHAANRHPARAEGGRDGAAALGSEGAAAGIAAYARAHGGRFLLYRSAARGTMKYDGGVDLLLDFPPEAQNDAWGFAERACWDNGLEPDILPFGGCKAAFLEHIAPDMMVLA
jgi:hypothetical protein